MGKSTLLIYFGTDIQYFINNYYSYTIFQSNSLPKIQKTSKILYFLSCMIHQAFPALTLFVGNRYYIFELQMSCNSAKMNPQQQQSAFDSVKTMINLQKIQGNSSTQSANVEQLHALCKELIATNRQLNEQIQILKEQLQAKTVPSTQNIFTDEYSQIQLDFTDIEQNMKDYRRELERYQNKVTQQLRERAGIIDRLREEAVSSQEKMANQRVVIDELESERQTLLQTNNNLLLEIEELEATIKVRKSESPRSIRKSNEYKDYGHFESRTVNSSFNDNVQQQLERLIEKLVRELQHERYLKRKLYEESRRLQNEIVELQKENVHKNSRIYELEMLIIKNNKQSVSNIAVNSHNYRTLEGRGHSREPSKSSKGLRQFTFMEIINNDVKISANEKLIITMKTIDFYIRKIQNEDFESYSLESIAICNYIPNNINRVIIRTNRNPSIEGDYGQSETQLVWNMACLLDSLLKKQLDSSQSFAELALSMDILDFLNKMIEDKSENCLKRALELRKIVEHTINNSK